MQTTKNYVIVNESGDYFAGYDNNDNTPKFYWRDDNTVYADIETANVECDVLNSYHKIVCKVVTKLVKNVFTEVLNSSDTTQIFKLEYPESYGYGKFSTIDSNYLDRLYLDENKPISKGIYYYSSALLSFGDYDNSCNVERSNVRMFIELANENNFTDYLHIKGDYSSESIYIDIASDNTEIIECLNSLQSYSAINDEDCCLVTMEIESECWASYLNRDFVSAIQKHYDAWDSDVINEDKLLQLFHSLKEKSNTYEEIQMGGNYWIDLDMLISALPEDSKELSEIITFEFDGE